MTEIRKVKRTTTIEISGAPFVGPARPYKIEVVEYADKGKVTATSSAMNGRPPHSTSWKLYGYPHYAVPPEWVIQLLSEAGWTLNKVWSDA